MIGNIGRAGNIAVEAAIGGTAEALGGGKFANGAITGAYVVLFNHATYTTTKCNLYPLPKNEHPFAQPYLKVVSW